MSERIHLRAESPEDLALLSALVQDMAVKADDIGWLRTGRRLAFVGNRYRWEARSADGEMQGGGSRIRSALRFDFVDEVQRRNWPSAAGAVLAVLAITVDADSGILIAFSGGPMLRLKAEVLDVTLEDLSGAWKTRNVPRHD